ncbi:MAG: CDGSH iron-sulfur domain-containing protein [Thermoleophilaceae bacterium]
MSSSAEGDVRPGQGGRRRPRPTTLRPYPDGPVVLRGPFRLVDETGAAVPTHRRTVALCRCGRSRLGAICDGTHRSVGYRAPAGPAREVGEELVVPLAVEPG